MDKICFDRWEWWNIKKSAEARVKMAQIHGFSQKGDNHLSFSEVDEMGLAGEWAFYKMLDRWPVFSQDKKEVGKPDIVVHSKTVEIKTTDKMTNNLMVEIEPNKPMRDLYVLMIVQKPAVYYAGYVRGKNLFVPDKVMTLNGTQFYKAFQKELFKGKFWELESREFPIIPKSGNLQKVAEVGAVVKKPASEFYEAPKGYPGQKTRVERI